MKIIIQISMFHHLKSIIRQQDNQIKKFMSSLVDKLL